MSIINYQSGSTALMLNSEADSGVDNYDYTRILSMLRAKSGFIFTDIELRLKADKTYVDQLVANAILGTVLPMAANISVADAGNYYTGVNVETVLQEVWLNKSNVTGGQLKFPSTQIPSTDVNTLDDYEEGTFNVTDASGAGLIFTYTGLGYYVKIGKLVTIRFDITFPTTANSAFAYISYPFPPISEFGGSIGFHTVGAPITLFGGNFYNVNGSASTNAQLSGKRIAGTITYIATA